MDRTRPSRLALLPALVLALMLAGTLSSRSAAAPSTSTVVLEKQETGFFVPPRTRGDSEFGGNGPKVKVSVELKVSSDRKKLLAVMKMSATETKNDRTTASGTTSKVVYRTTGSQRILGIESPTESKASYTDTDHQEDYFVPPFTAEKRPDDNHLITDNASKDQAVRLFVVVGDTDGGGEAGTKTGFRAFLNPITLRVSGTAAKSKVKILEVEDGGADPQDNGCSANAGYRVLQFYGHKVGQSKLYKELESSGNMVSDAHWGVPPGTLRDRLRKYDKTFVEKQYSSKSQAREAMFCLIDANTPVILLTGWGSKTVRDIYAPDDDVVGAHAGRDMLHYVVLNGYDKNQKLFHIIDNGTAKVWSYSYFENVLFWEAESGSTAFAFGVAAQVHNRTVVYRNRTASKCAPKGFSGQKGAPCSGNNDCKSGVCTRGKCESDNRTVGQSCGSSRQCESKRCDIGAHAPGTKKCIPNDFTGKDGKYCSHNNHCKSGQCTNKKCATADKPDGATCKSSRQCKSKRCSGNRCIPKDFTGKDGKYCSHNNHCRSGVCTNRKCATGNKKSGQSCKSERQCKSRRCSGNRCIPKDSKGTTGEYCSHDNHCKSKRCRNKKCAK